MSVPATLLLALATPSVQDPAASMPPDVFSYLEVDVGALERHLPELDVARFLADPANRDFLAPTFARLDLDPEQPVRDLLDRLQAGRWIRGRAAVGLRGLHLWVRHPDGAETRLDLSPSSPLSARGVLDLLGMLASMRMDGSWGLGPDDMESGLDLVLVLEPGPRLQEEVRRLLADPDQLGDVVADVHQDQLAGRTATHVVFEPRRTRGVLTDLYGDLSGSRWLVTSRAATFADAAGLQPADSLAAGRDFAAMRRRLTTGAPVLFQFTDAAQELALVRSLVPPILVEAMDIAGLDAYRGSGFAVSLAEGGIHESLGLLLDGAPDGIWRLGDAMPGGLATARRAPRDAAALVALKFDPALFVQRLEEVAETLLPGTGHRLRGLLAVQARQAGLDLEDDVLAALGDEVGLVVFPPPAPMVPPDWALLWRLRDEAGARRLLDRLRALATAGVPELRVEDAEFAPGLPGMRLVVPGAPVLPALLLHDGWLVCAARPDLAVQAAREWGQDPAATLAGDSGSWRRTLRGLTGGGDEDVALLAWLDLHQLLPQAFAVLAPMLPPDAVDATAAPLPEDLAAFFPGGAAVAVRHDEDGITLDTFSPVGVLLPSLAAGVAGRPRRGGDAVAFAGPSPDEAFTAMQQNEDAWVIARMPDGDLADYARAVELARAAVASEPDNPWFLNTLGVALYRLGEYREAVEVLERAAARNQEVQGYHPATDWLFLAMASWQLGEWEQAREWLARSRAALQDVDDAELAGFLAEAEGLIREPGG